VLGYRQHPSFRGSLWLHRRWVAHGFWLDENPSNQAKISLFHPKVLGRSELGRMFPWRWSRDALQAAELSEAPLEVDVAGQEGAGDSDTFSSGEEWF